MIIDGKKIAADLEQEIKEALMKSKKIRIPKLAMVVVGENPASISYVASKAQACKRVGIEALDLSLSETITQEDLLDHIKKLNLDPTVDGILVQVPLPSHINEGVIDEAISPKKDVDGFHPINMGKLLLGFETGFTPCTPLGTKILLERSGIEVAGKHVVIIGRSHIVGKPLATLLMQKKEGANATVTVVHSQTQDLPKITQQADILIAAMGVPHFVTANMVKEGAYVIDIGNNRIPDARKKSGYRIVGDVDFDSVKQKCRGITPVPGGVGPMTVVCLLKNTFNSYMQTIIK